MSISKINFFFIFFLIFISCVSPSKKIIQEKQSPDGEKLAVVYEIGGATVSNNRHVSIIELGERIKGKGNIFTLEGVKCDVDWNSDFELIISYSGKVYYRKEELNVVRIICCEEKLNAE